MGHWFRYVTIRPRTPEIRGQVHVGRPRLRESYRLAVTCYAGPSAQVQFLRCLPALRWEDHLHFVGCDDDIDTAGRVLPEHWQRDQAARHAKDLVTGNWSWIAAVAHQLLAGGRALTYREVERIGDEVGSP